MKQLIRLTLEETSQLVGQDQNTIIHYIEEEWINPFDPMEKLFDDEDVQRIRLIHDLLDVLGVNEEAVPVILHLIDQIHCISRSQSGN
ncbi:MAG: MerR family transcriptional regulator [Bacteriovoracaceae bacterium]